MNPEVKESEFTTTRAPGFAEPTSSVGDNGDEPLLLPPANSQFSDQLGEIGEKIKAFLATLPADLADFFSEYQRPLVVIALIFGGFVTFKMTLAVLDAVDDIPLLAPSFELIGFGYTAWFVYRYLLRATSRQELVKEIDSFKDQVVGKLPK